MATRLTDLRIQQGDYSALDDRMLVLDFQAGNPEAFVEIHQRYGGLARHVCHRMLRNAADTDEAFQETMVRVFQGLYRFNGRYALQSWIARIATNVSLDVIRTRARRPQLHEEALEDLDREDPADGPEETFERLLERDLVLAVLSELPDSHRRALILRELEGRSHIQIGEAIGISPSQAKALIHRAKMSFRRRWMQKVVDRGGVAGIALVPLALVLKLGDAVRRFADRAGHAAQAAQAAVPDVVSTAGQTVVTATGGGFGERVIAASMTLLVAGGVTVGATAIVKDDGEPETRVRAEAVAPEAPVPVAEPEERLASPASGDELDDLPPKEAQGPPEVVGEPVVTEPAPEDDATAPAAESPPAEPSEEPAPQPSPEPSPEPTEQPPPPTPPAWAGSFGIGWTSDDLCACAPVVTLVATETKGDLLSPDGVVKLHQELSGAATDAEGDAAWAFTADLRADLTRSGGSISLPFSLIDDGVESRFVASGWVTEVAGDIDHGESLAYTFSGAYSIDGSPEATSPIKVSGGFSAKIVVWTDGVTPVVTQLTLIP